MKYWFKRTEEGITVRPPDAVRMGAEWYAEHGYEEYNGTIPPDRFGLDENGSPTEQPSPEIPSVRVFSSLKIRDTLAAAGLWSTVKEALELFGEYERFILADDIREDDPGFAAMLEKIGSMPVASGVDVDEILNKCTIS